MFQLHRSFTGWVPTYWAPQVHPNYGSGDCDFAPPKNGLISVAGCSWYRNVKNTVWNAHLICHLRPGEVYESTGACTLASTLWAIHHATEELLVAAKGREWEGRGERGKRAVTHVVGLVPVLAKARRNSSWLPLGIALSVILLVQVMPTETIQALLIGIQTTWRLRPLWPWAEISPDQGKGFAFHMFSSGATI